MYECCATQIAVSNAEAFYAASKRYETAISINQPISVKLIRVGGMVTHTHTLMHAHILSFVARILFITPSLR